MITRRIVCLANSRKPGGRCVAGLTWEEETDPAKWIRPIGPGETEAVTARDRCYQNGAEPQLLDVLDVALLRDKPRSHQPENWLIDTEQWWGKSGELQPADLFDLEGATRPLWQRGFQSRQHEHNRVPVSASVEESLRLIHVQNLALRRYVHGEGNSDRTRLQARFVYDEERYVLAVTDPVIEESYKEVGLTRVGSAFLTVSLGEPYEGFFYKLVAGIVPLP